MYIAANLGNSKSTQTIRMERANNSSIKNFQPQTKVISSQKLGTLCKKLTWGFTAPVVN